MSKNQHRLIIRCTCGTTIRTESALKPGVVVESMGCQRCRIGFVYDAGQSFGLRLNTKGKTNEHV